MKTQRIKVQTKQVQLALKALFLWSSVWCLVLAVPSAAFAWQASEFKKPTAAELRKKLTPLQFKVTQEEGTEQPFKNEFWNNHEEGVYVDVVSGEPLFSSMDKFDSGTGWPSFTATITKDSVITKSDKSLFAERTEVKSRYAGSHLGHLFNDGPQPTGHRYCMDSASLRFIARKHLEKEGYGEFAALFSGKAGATNKPDNPSSKENTKPKLETATLAGGCFWGMEEIFRKAPGVMETKVGYTGGTQANPVYEQVSSGTTGHAEAIEIKYDPEKTSYEKILTLYFKMHDPTSLNRQGNDKGTQYRSEIFYHDHEQELVAKRIMAKVNASKKWGKEVVTQVAPAGQFYAAKEHHQKYLQKNPGGYNDHFVRDFDFGQK